MRQSIQQSKIAIAELVAKLQEEQAKLERMEARVEKYEEAIAFLQEAIAEDPLLWGEVRDRLQPAWLQDAENLKDRILRTLYGYHSCHVSLQELSRFLNRDEREILPWLQRLEPDFMNSSEDGFRINIGGVRYVEALEATLSAASAQTPTSEQIFDAEINSQARVEAALPPTIIWDGNGSARLGCAKQKLAKEWKDLLTLWGCAAEVTKAESFSDKEIKWEIAIANITRSQMETLAKAHTSPHAEVPSPGRKVENLDADIERGHEVWRQPYRLQSPSSEQIFDAECLPRDKTLSALILGYLDEADEPTDFADICQLAQELEFGDEAQVVEALESLKTEGRIFEIREQPWLWSVDPVNSTTVEEVLEGDSPLNLSAAQMDELEDALVGSPPPAIDDIVEEKPSAYAEEMALKIKPGAKVKSLLYPKDPKHQYSKTRTGIVTRTERIGANIYVRVAELTGKGKNSRQTAQYNIEAIEILEDAPTIKLAIGAEDAVSNDFDHFEPFDPVEADLQSGDVLGGLEAEISQFLTEKAAQADLYEGNDPTASLSEIGDATKLDFPDWDRLHTALDNLVARGSILYRVGNRWQVASEKPAQKEEHNFKVGDRVVIQSDAKGEDLVGKAAILTAVSLTGCVLFIDGTDQKDRLFFPKEDLLPFEGIEQAA